MARVAEERARIGEHADEVAEAAERAERLQLLAHAVLLVEEPPGRAQLHAALLGAVLEAAHERGEHLVVLRVEGVEDRARKRAGLLQAVEEARERGRHVPFADAVEAGVGTEQLEHLRVGVAQAAVVELRRPAGFRVRRQPLVEPRALQLERLLGSERLAAARLLEDAAHFRLGVRLGEDLGDAVVGYHATALREEGVPLRHGLKEVVPSLDGHLRCLGETVHPVVPGLQVLHLAGLVAAPCGQDARAERLLRDRDVVFERVNGIVGGADNLHVGLLHEPLRGKAGLREGGVALLPYLLGRLA